MFPEWLEEKIASKLESTRVIIKWTTDAYRWSYRVIGRRLFVGVGIVICLWATLDFFVLNESRGIEDQTFDKVMQMRWNEPKASEDIIIITIDEKSLSEMAGEFGRWPWPRGVFGEIIDFANQAGAKAIVFDIVFSDPDKFNLNSDKRFNDAIENAPNVFLPIIRLDDEAGRQSKLLASQIPGLQTLTNNPLDKTVGLVWPAFLPGAISNANFGTVNLYPADDGITRDYRLYSDEGGYRLPSMALKVAEDAGDYKLIKNQEQIRINWRGKKSDYKELPFSQLYSLLKNGNQNAKEQIANKILIIGVTAPALFDQKAIPIANVYPGVKIMANAMDNLINKDFIVMMPPWVSYVVAILFVILLCALLSFGVKTKILDKTFASFQIVFLGVTLTVINYSSYYIDLSMPFYYGLTAYALMRTYLLASQQYARGKGMFKFHLPEIGPYAVSMAHISVVYIGNDKRKETVACQEALEIVKETTLNSQVRLLLNDRPMDDQGLFTDLFENHMFVLYICSENKMSENGFREEEWVNDLMNQIEASIEFIKCPVKVSLDAFCTEHNLVEKDQVIDVARRTLGRVLSV